MIGFFKRLFVAILVIGALGALGYFLMERFKQSQDQQGPRITGSAKRGDFSQSITFAGSIVTARRVNITAPYSGYIKSLYPKLGAKVTAGDPLVVIAASLDSDERLHPLRAPFTGTVTLINKTEGEFVKEGDTQDYILRIDDLSKFLVEAKIPEIDRNKIAQGLEAIIKISSTGEHTYSGIVRRVSLAPAEKQGFSFGGKAQVEYPLQIEITNKDERLMPGMSAIIDVIVVKKSNALLLGHEFVGEDAGQHFVTLANGEKRSVTTGVKNDESVEILSGLDEGELVQQVEFMP